MGKPRKIVVGGFAIGFPIGGQMWFMLHYILGMARLGHEVLFVEGSGNWAYPFDADQGMYVADSTYGRNLMEKFFSRYGLSGRWAYHSEIEGKYFGWSREDVDRYIKEADLMVNISGLLPMEERYFTSKTRVYMDTDPVFTQIKASEREWDQQYMALHNAHYTLGVNLPGGDHPVPMVGLDWKPINPPVVTDLWEVIPGPGTHYTTVGTWDTKDRDMVIAGERYSWRKSVQYEKIMDLPKRVRPGVKFELAYSNMDEAREAYEAAGWTISDGIKASSDLWGYQNFISNSRAEFTVAKDQNIRLKSGWFSDRATSYLAAGRPVITQDCGVGRYLPVGEGLFTFETLDEILAAVESIESDYERHRKAARRLAEEHFEAEKIFAKMMKELDLD